jgi:DNA replication protein DnaC
MMSPRGELHLAHLRSYQAFPTFIQFEKLANLRRAHIGFAQHRAVRDCLLILDDWMRDAITVPNAQDLLEVLDDRFGHSSTLLASQVPVADWHLRIPDPTLADAILDRIVHNASAWNSKENLSASSEQIGPFRTPNV